MITQIITFSPCGRRSRHGEGDLLKHLDNKKGFTLIELMIVVVIIVVLIAIAGTTWLLSLNHLSLRNDAGEIKSALQKAKQRAVTTGRLHQVYFDIANEVYQIEDCNLDAAGIITPDGNNCNVAIALNFAGSGPTHGTVVGSLRDLRITTFGHKSIDINLIDAFNAGNAWAQFRSDGTATFYSGAANMTITLARTDGSAETKAINLNSNGRVNVP